MRILVRKKRRVFINITSLIDVMFLLLIFFMVSSTFIEKPGMKLDLPGAETSQLAKIEKLVLQVNTDGRILLNSEPVILDNLQEKIKSVISELPDVPLFLEADQNVSHGMVVRIMDIAKKSGVKKLTIATKEIVPEGD